MNVYDILKIDNLDGIDIKTIYGFYISFPIPIDFLDEGLPHTFFAFLNQGNLIEHIQKALNLELPFMVDFWMSDNHGYNNHTRRNGQEIFIYYNVNGSYIHVADDLFKLDEYNENLVKKFQIMQII